PTEVFDGEQPGNPAVRSGIDGATAGGRTWRGAARDSVSSEARRGREADAASSVREMGVRVMTRFRRLLQWPVALAGVVAAGYGSSVATTWLRFGRRATSASDDTDLLLDQLMPEYEVAERHHVHVAAPAEITLAAAREIDLRRSAIIRTIFAMREWLLNAGPGGAARPTDLVAFTTSLGWRLVAENPGREVVYGAVTQPWRADVVFRGLAAEEFRKFREPGFVKILWTLRVDPETSSHCIFRTKTP